MTFVVRGDQAVAPLNRSLAFSNFAVERCSSVSFRAAEFQANDETAHKARAADATLPDIRLLCYDADAKVSLWRAPEGPVLRVSGEVGLLDGVRFRPGTRVMLEVRSTPAQADEQREPEPVLTVDVSTPQELSLSIQREEFKITTELVSIEPSTLDSNLPLATYRVRRDPAFETLTVSAHERGPVLIITPTKHAAQNLFDNDTSIPVESLQFVDEKTGGGVKPALKSWTLAYPEFPEIKPKEPKDGSQFLVLSEMTDTEVWLQGLAPDLSGLEVTVEGNLEKGVTGRPDAATPNQGGGRWEDLRLTKAETIVHAPRWMLVLSALGSMIVITSAWLVAGELLWNRLFPTRPQ
jgi:hypothetical protein